MYTVNGEPFWGDFDADYETIAGSFPEQVYEIAGYRGFEDSGPLNFQVGSEAFLIFEGGSTADKYWGYSEAGKQVVLDVASEFLERLS